jgi:hypothetical protein
MATMRRAASAPAATPAPIPAFAPVLKPPSACVCGCSVVELAVGVGVAPEGADEGVAMGEDKPGDVARA